MAQIAVLYGTTEGQTERIAERIADRLETAGHEATLAHLNHLPDDFTVADYDAAIFGASVHLGRHQGYVTQFVTDHVTTLNGMPTAFISVSLTAAESQPDNQKPAREILETFLSETGWNPDLSTTVAGALTYRQYGRVKRLLMRWIARKAGGATDTSRDSRIYRLGSR